MIEVPSAEFLLKVYARSRLLPTAVVRDRGLLESALQRPNLTFMGEERFGTIHEKVAAAADAIARTHPLVDGNKRLSVVAPYVIYSLNGWAYVGPDPDDDLWVWLANSHPAIEELAARFEKRWKQR